MAKILEVLRFGNNLWSFSEGMLGPLLAVFTEKIGGSILDITWAWALYLITTGILMILIGSYSDNGYKKQFLVIGLALSTFFTFGYIFVDSILDLFIVQIGLGIAAALAIPTWDALYSTYGDDSTTGNGWGLANGQELLLEGVGILIGGIIVFHFSFTLLFIIMGTFQAIATLYVGYMLFYEKILKKKHV